MHARQKRGTAKAASHLGGPITLTRFTIADEEFGNNLEEMPSTISRIASSNCMREFVILV